MIGPLEVLKSFGLTQWRSRRSLTRARFEAWQERAVSRWIRTQVSKVGFYDRTAQVLGDLPVTEKAMIMADFAAFNTEGLDAAAAWDIQKNGGRQGDLTIGASTGTSGNRGMFVINEVEKLRWLDAIVAKTMADLIWKPQRVAIVLPSDTGLYSSANKMSFIKLRTFSTLEPAQGWRAEIEAFAPTVIVAPPKMLRLFADNNFALNPVRVFSAAETLDPLDRVRIEAYFDQTLRQIYMATEGLLAVSCSHGMLHLCEDSVAFEFEDAGGGLVSPLITSFRRDTQIMARYRMNDLLRLADAPCPCGSPLRGVVEVVGRLDDVFRFDGGAQITPDVLRNAVLNADRAIADFRLEQEARDLVTLRLHEGVNGDAARAALLDLFAQFGAHAEVHVIYGDIALETGPKLRRVHSKVAS